MMAQRKPDSPSLRVSKWGVGVERCGGNRALGACALPARCGEVLLRLQSLGRGRAVFVRAFGSVAAAVTGQEPSTFSRPFHGQVDEGPDLWIDELALQPGHGK